MIQRITAQGELVGQNLMYSTSIFENRHKDLLSEFKQQRQVGYTEWTTTTFWKYVDKLL